MTDVSVPLERSQERSKKYATIRRYLEDSLTGRFYLGTEVERQTNGRLTVPVGIEDEKEYFTFVLKFGM